MSMKNLSHCTMFSIKYNIFWERISHDVREQYTLSHTEQDAREAMRVVFSVLTKRICMHKTTFLRRYSNIVLKVILNCMNMQIATQLIMMYNL